MIFRAWTRGRSWPRVPGFDVGGNRNCPPLPKLTSTFWTGALAVITFLVYGLFGAVPQDWVYNPSAVAAGEWWRVWSAQLVHCDVEHLVLNVVALVVLGSLLPQRAALPALVGFCLTGLAVTVWLVWWRPEIAAYCGLSAYLNTLVGLAVATGISGPRRRFWLALGLADLVKILLEIHLDAALLSSTAWPALPEVHLIGMVVGFLGGSWAVFGQRG